MDKSSYGGVVLTDNFISFLFLSILDMILTPLYIIAAILGTSIDLTGSNGGIGGGAI